MDKKTKDCQQAENLARHYETRYAEESNKYNTALADKKKAQDEARVCTIQNITNVDQQVKLDL